MFRPWYVWCITLLAAALLAATAVRLLLIWNGGAPGAVVEAVTRRVRTVRPDSPLARAGVRVGDRLRETPALGAGARILRRFRVLQWRTHAEEPVAVMVQRAGRVLTLMALPERPPAAVRLVWGLLALLQVAWSGLALVVLWQHPRDRRAVLLALVLLGAQSLFVPLTPRPLVLAVTLHLFLAFPTPLPFLTGRRHLAAIYLPALFAGPLGVLGLSPPLEAISDAVSVTYALLACAAAAARLRDPAADGGQVRMLILAAVAILLATTLAALEPAWLGSQWLLPLSLIPAGAFGLAISDLLFRRHALEVRLFLRAGVRYALARRALAALFFLPALLLAFRLGRLSAGEGPITPEVLVPYLGWTAAVALVGVTRDRLLEALDRRFFQEAHRAHQAVATLGKALASAPDEEAIVATTRLALEEGFGISDFGVRISDLGESGPEQSEIGAPTKVGHPKSEIPVERAGRHLGTLVIGDRSTGAPYTAEDRRLLEGVAAQVAVALDGIRLQEALLTQQRRALELRSRALLDGAEEERRRLAADLHDQVLPELRYLAAEAERLRTAAGPALNGLSAKLGDLEETTRAAMDGVREVMEALRPSTLDVLGFSDAVESCLRKGAARVSPSPRVVFRRTGPEPSLTPEQSLALLRIAQEAINNAVAHAHPSTLTVELTHTADRLHLRVADDGPGFRQSPSGLTINHQPSTINHPHRGLDNMRYRAELIGARIAWRSREGEGTSVDLELLL